MYSRFNDLIESKGIRAAQVAKATGISTATLSDWKMGRSKPKRDKIVKIAEYLHVNPDYLTGESDDPTAEAPRGYYVNSETLAAAQELFDNPELRILFDAARDARPEDLKLAAEMLLRFKRSREE